MSESNSIIQKQPSGSKRKTKIVIGIAVAAAIVIIAVIALSMGNFGANNYKATIYVHVTSAHIANVIDIELFTNGNSFRSDSLNALSSQVYQYDAWLSGSSENITISGTGQGGILGDTSDSSTIDVADGRTYNVYLTL